ncbi:hypothetical protein GFB56_05540 [Ensifer sp. T173]|uniref:DUF6950 domain-containing protein n=1 Tax=Ensifer canadensis TaxID=555315 RepID=A0AAW4FGY9_9HYPH|nr:hypothetical protein [Ensifer canadensis]MBM3090276.1 hypothetical protein [Ensifer canadensis]UBI75809.1 hypothetical protein J3R84_01215 [Ensifer canadensis]
MPTADRMSLDLKFHHFIEESMKTPLVWGVSDCSSWPAAWVEKITGTSIMLPVWGSETEAFTLIAAAGSLEALWHQALAVSGLRQTGAPELGDVGIIETRVCGQVGGIFLPAGLFAWRAEIGVRMLVPRQVVAAWSFR